MNYRTLISIILSILLTSCAKTSFTPVVNLDSMDAGATVLKTRPACEVPEVDYLLETKIIEFTNTKNKDIAFGFNLIPGFEYFRAFDAKFKLKKSTMTVSTSMSEFLKPQASLAQATGHGEAKISSWGFNIDLNKIKLGPSFFTATPMFEVMNQALTDSLIKTANSMDNLSTPWNTVVASIPNENEYLIPTGKNAGIQVGDEFEIFNIEHRWAGEPCKSAYLMAVTQSEQPIAILSVNSEKDLTPNAARLRIKQRILPDTIVQGAFVYVHKSTLNRNLLRSVAIKKIFPFQLTWTVPGTENIEVIDATSILGAALGPVLRQVNYYIKPLTN